MGRGGDGEMGRWGDGEMGRILDFGFAVYGRQVSPHTMRYVPDTVYLAPFTLHRRPNTRHLTPKFPSSFCLSFHVPLSG